ncbi:MAG: DUF1501 domain-containing protein [Myxococcota bacterium]
MTNHEHNSRRKFLKNVLVAGGATAIGGLGGLGTLSSLARGAGEEERFYVFVYFAGGWDILMSLDPRDPGVFTNENVGVTRIMPGYDVLGIDEPLQDRSGIRFGPFIGELGALASDLCVIRGMSMDTLTHEVGRRRFITGKSPSGLLARGSAGSAWLASAFGGNEPIPNLSIRVESFNPDLPSWASALRVSNSSDLVAMLRRADPLLGEELDLEVNALLEDEALCPRSRHAPLLREADSSRRRVRTLIERDLQSLFDFRASTPEMEALRDRYGIGNDFNGAEAQAAVAAQALASGVCRCVTIQGAGGLDTHFNDWETDQGPRQQRGFNAVARLVRHLKELPFRDTGESLFDRTTIVGFSEFMRTPMINARGGRDHWLTNSCFLIGGNIQGGQVIGASTDTGMAPGLTNFESGQPDPGGQVIYPEHILRTLLVDAGIENDAADLRVDGLPALLRT